VLSIVQSLFGIPRLTRFLERLFVLRSLYSSTYEHIFTDDGHLVDGSGIDLYPTSMNSQFD
jgi:hypothetical protein